MTQIYHCPYEAEICWYEFAKKTFQIAEVGCKVNPIKAQQYPTSAKRPRNTTMRKSNVDEIFHNILSIGENHFTKVSVV